MIRYNYIGYTGEVLATTYFPDGWHPVPRGITITGMRLGDWVASEDEVGERPQEVPLYAQTFAAPGTIRIEVIVTES